MGGAGGDVLGERIGAGVGIMGAVVDRVEDGVGCPALTRAIGEPVLHGVCAGGENVGVMTVVVDRVEAGLGGWAGRDRVLAGCDPGGEEFGERVGGGRAVGGAIFGQAELRAGVAAFAPASGLVVEQGVHAVGRHVRVLSEVGCGVEVRVGIAAGLPAGLLELGKGVLAGGVGVGGAVIGDAEQGAWVAALGPAERCEVQVGIDAGGGDVRVAGEVIGRVEKGVDGGESGAGGECIKTERGGTGGGGGCRDRKSMTADGEGVTDESAGLSGEVDDVAGLEVRDGYRSGESP